MSQPLHCQKAEELLGIKFRHRGRTLAGLDCIGVIAWLAQELDAFQVFDRKIYGREPHQDNLRQAMRQNMGQPIQGELYAGLVVLMQLPGQPAPSHVALVVEHPDGGLALIHSYAAAGSVRRHRLDKFRRAQIVEAYPWPVKD